MQRRGQKERRDTLPAPGVAPSTARLRASLLLPGPVWIAQAVDASRQALCAFLTMEADPSALGPWVLGPYREATRFATSTPSVAGRPEGAATILAAQRKSARVIEAASRGTEALVSELPPVVHIRPAHDRFGGRGFVPFDAAGTPLVVKVVALALADYFTRPEEFLAHEYATGARLLRRISGEMCAMAVGESKR
jgi:hypothetical protein